jgi:hypothetical protein
VRGGARSVAALDELRNTAGVELCIITATAPSAGNARSLAGEVRRLGLSAHFDAASADEHRADLRAALCGRASGGSGADVSSGSGSDAGASSAAQRELDALSARALTARLIAARAGAPECGRAGADLWRIDADGALCCTTPRLYLRVTDASLRHR